MGLHKHITVVFLCDSINKQLEIKFLICFLYNVFDLVSIDDISDRVLQITVIYACKLFNLTDKFARNKLKFLNFLREIEMGYSKFLCCNPKKKNFVLYYV